MTKSPDTRDEKQGNRWPKGLSGNPRGRPKGARHAALVALDQMGADGAQDALRAVVEAAKGGDVRAADILLRRVWPERRGRPVAIDLPPLARATDLAAALGALVAAVAEGELTPEEGQALAGIVESHRRAIETGEIEQRLAALEHAAGRKVR